MHNTTLPDAALFSLTRRSLDTPNLIRCLQYSRRLALPTPTDPMVLIDLE